MPSPTQFYGWTLPTEGSDPWYPAIDDLVTDIDMTVHSVAVVSRPRATIVVSLIPSSALVITSDAMIGAGGWVVCSAAPMGLVAGSFSLVGSGAQVMLQLNLSGYADATVSQVAVGTLWRVVAARTGASSLAIPPNSMWNITPTVGYVRGSWGLTTIASLGPGNYTAELQARIYATTAASRFVMNFADAMVLTALEVARG